MPAPSGLRRPDLARVRGPQDRALARAPQLGQFPLSRRHVPERDDPALRDVLEGPYRVIHRVRPERVEMPAIEHGRRADLGRLEPSE